MRGVYVLHIEPAYKHAVHYTGFSWDIEKRVLEHLSGKGAILPKAAIRAGCHLILVHVEVNADRKRERAIKNMGAGRSVCPICMGGVVQLPIGIGAVAAFSMVDKSDCQAVARVHELIDVMYSESDSGASDGGRDLLPEI